MESLLYSISCRVIMKWVAGSKQQICEELNWAIGDRLKTCFYTPTVAFGGNVRASGFQHVTGFEGIPLNAEYNGLMATRRGSFDRSRVFSGVCGKV